MEQYAIKIFLFKHIPAYLSAHQGICEEGLMQKSETRKCPDEVAGHANKT